MSGDSENSFWYLRVFIKIFFLLEDKSEGQLEMDVTKVH